MSVMSVGNVYKTTSYMPESKTLVRGGRGESAWDQSCTLLSVKQVTSTTFNYYTGLIETSKTHFYGRAAAELSFSEGIFRTFTRVPGSSLLLNACRVDPIWKILRWTYAHMKARAMGVQSRSLDVVDSRM